MRLPLLRRQTAVSLLLLATAACSGGGTTSTTDAGGSATDGGSTTSDGGGKSDGGSTATDGGPVNPCPLMTGGQLRFDDDLHGVWAAAKDDVWLVGDKGRVLHWNGVALAPRATGTTTDFQAVWGQGKNDVWMVGNGQILHWDGQTLADIESYGVERWLSELAQDLREEVRGLIRQGKSDAEVKQYLVQRYGDFVLYRPPLKTTTLVLWLGPPLLFLIGLWLLLRFLRQRRAGGGAKAHGRGHAARPLGDAVVRIARRQIQHVAGLQHELGLGLEATQDFQRQARLQSQVICASDAPTPAPLGLKQKHVVAVEMGSHTAPVAGPTDHHIVKSGVGHKTELTHEVTDAVIVQIDPLDQKRPGALGSRWKGPRFERAVAHRPILGALGDQARFDVGLGRQRFEVLHRQWRLEPRHRLAHEQGLFLPMAAHELAGT